MTVLSLRSPLVGTVVAVNVAVGDVVAVGAELLIIESMKMEHPLIAEMACRLTAVFVEVGQTVDVDQVLVECVAVVAQEPIVQGEIAATTEREDLTRLLTRRALLHDDARQEAVEKRHAKGQRTARENIADLVDTHSFIEYGGFGVAAQRGRRSEEDLIANTPADGLITGLATINADIFGAENAHCAVVAYDYTVLAGTQGFINHRKKDRIFEIAKRSMTPVVLFAEGGGGRPGDTDAPGVAGLDVMSFASFAQLSGLVPLVGVASGYCFAGNAALLGCCDVVIATENSNIGMAGPAMIEGGGLGTVKPTDIGPIATQSVNGVVDVRVVDEAEAVAVVQKYLSYFQGVTTMFSRHSDDALRELVPEQRTRVYDVRAIINTLADIDSVLELRPDFGVGIVTLFARIEGRPVGIVANNPAHLGGAIDTPAADKMARFIQLCDAFDVPIVSLCDTPGFMVGPQAEETAQVRHFARLFVTAASTTVPWVTVVLRKGYGLGAQAMAGGSFHAKDMVVAWPTGEFGGMGLEGAVRLGFKKELDAARTSEERVKLEKRLIASAYMRGSALSMASHTEIDDVIDPAQTREVILGVLSACPMPPRRSSKKRPMVDTW
ncbi:MAG: carboxyl transferase domain-containing protein [Ilumatobacteraceae bacterium]|jgi:acetyl-CoA carboxylase carboxyltransferase component